jgi:hypothetical protein
MTAVKLQLKRYRTHRLDGHQIHSERILALIRIGGRLLREAVVDTGAPVTMFPEVIWRHFENDIRWLTTRNDPTVPDWCRRFGGVAGGAIPCRIGLVSIEILSIKKNRIGPEQLGPSDLLAMFAFDGGRAREILLGLAGGFLDNRRLEFIYDTASVILRALP